MPKFTDKPKNINKTKANSEYIPLNILPSGFKPYSVEELLVSGLRIGDIKALNKITSEQSLEMIVAVYKNLVHNFDILDLTPIDFKAVMFFIAYQTDETFALTIKNHCPNNKTVKQVKKEQVEESEDIEVLPEFLDPDGNPMPKVKDEDGNILDEIEEPCGHVFTEEITIFDVDYEEIGEIEYKVQDLVINPIRLRDIIFYKQLNKIDPDLDYVLGIMALCSDYEIANELNQEAFIEQYKKIENLPGKEIKTLAEIYKSFDLDLNNMELECPKCGYKFISKLVIDYSKVYP